MSGLLPCSICGNYWCNGMHHVVGCQMCHSYPCTCTSGWGWAGTTTFKWPPDPQRLHPDDIEAIAKRVVEMMKESAGER